ncbi:MAG: hypothetical protein HYR60_10670 [Acidobacteria bacterium]|nr:hypothetical protein [Acidobacteriota bacterium]
MSRWKHSILLAAVVALAWGQMPSERGEAVTRVGMHLACQCGHCGDTVSGCKMQLCGSSAPARERIAKLQEAGMADRVILDTFLKEWGRGAYREMPSSWSWITPYLGLTAGLAFIVWFVRRSYRRPAAARAPAADPQLARYSEQIEKELQDLD